MAQCSGSHITEMQLFHELKQRFPNLPDRLVTHCIKQTRGDRGACSCILEAETLLSRYNRMSSGRRESGSEKEGTPSSSGMGSPAVTPPPPPPPPPSLSSSWLERANQRRTTPSPVDTPICLGWPRRSPSPGGSRDKPKRPPISRASSMPEIIPLERCTHLLIQDQLARKKKLEIELDKNKERLQKMKEDADNLEKELKARLQAPSHSSKVKRLKEEITNLHWEVDRLANEVDKASNNGVPLGETRIEFYRDIYTGQRGSLRPNSSRHRERRRVVEGVIGGDVGGSGGEGAHWCCHMCTFLNHPLLDKCEECYMPRITIGDERETQNIHIHVTHRNYPSCKVVHSWVL